MNRMKFLLGVLFSLLVWCLITYRVCDFSSCAIGIGELTYGLFASDVLAPVRWLLIVLSIFLGISIAYLVVDLIARIKTFCLSRRDEKNGV